MKKLCTKWFMKWTQKVNLSSHDILEAIENLEKGLSVAELGGNLFKVRVQRSGKGKSSGFRTIVAYRKEEKVIFLYGFGKNEKSNISKTELQYFKKLGSDLLSLDDEQIAGAIDRKILFNMEKS